MFEKTLLSLLRTQDEAQQVAAKSLSAASALQQAEGPNQKGCTVPEQQPDPDLSA